MFVTLLQYALMSLLCNCDVKATPETIEVQMDPRGYDHVINDYVLRPYCSSKTA